MPVMHRATVVPHLAEHQRPYRRPTPQQVAAIVDGYGFAAAFERWSESMSAETIKKLATEGRKLSH